MSAGDRPVSLCVINYNGARRLESVLAAAARSTLAFAEILVVDDASTDGSLALLRERYPMVRVVARERNEGPAAARNAGFRSATHDLILFLDNDVALRPDCARALHDALVARPDALVAQPRVLYAGRPDTIQYEGADCHFLGLMILRHHERRIGEVPDTTVETGSVVTCAFLLDRSRWRGGEPFDPSFIFNLEDHDFGVRSRLAGHTLLAVPAATCLHGEGTPGLSYRPGGVQTATRVYCLIRNRWRIVVQGYAARTLLLLAPSLAAYEVFQLLGALRKGWIGPWTRAAWWMVTNPATVLRRRREVQAGRRSPDGAVLVGGPIPFTPGLLARGPDRAARAVLERVTGAGWARARHRL